MAYGDARTNFVRKAISGRAWRDREYIDDLRRIEEELARPRPHGIATTLAISNLFSRYPREAEAIRRDLERLRGAIEEDAARTPPSGPQPLLPLADRIERHRREWMELGGLP